MKMWSMSCSLNICWFQSQLRKSFPTKILVERTWVKCFILDMKSFMKSDYRRPCLIAAIDRMYCTTVPPSHPGRLVFVICQPFFYTTHAPPKRAQTLGKQIESNKAEWKIPAESRALSEEGQNLCGDGTLWTTTSSTPWCALPSVRRPEWGVGGGPSVFWCGLTMDGFSWAPPPPHTHTLRVECWEGGGAGRDFLSPSL